MTKPDSDFDENAVQRALAAARHTAPMPADVAARLEQVIADLAAERTNDGTDGNGALAVPVELHARSRRKRRWTSAMMVAAASVVAVATAPQWWPSGSEDRVTADSQSATSANSAPSLSSPEAADGQSDQAGSAAEDAPDAASGLRTDSVPALTSARKLRPQLRALLTQDLSADAQPPRHLEASRCQPDALQGPRVLSTQLVTLDGKAAWVIQRQPAETSGTEVLLVRCDNEVVTSFIDP